MDAENSKSKTKRMIAQIMEASQNSRPDKCNISKFYFFANIQNSLIVYYSDIKSIYKNKIITKLLIFMS